MGFEMEFNKMYQRIAQKISDIIPVNWKEFYFQGDKPPKNDKEKDAFIKMHEYEQAHSS